MRSGTPLCWALGQNVRSLWSFGPLCWAPYPLPTSAEGEDADQSVDREEHGEGQGDCLGKPGLLFISYPEAWSL